MNFEQQVKAIGQQEVEIIMCICLQYPEMAENCANYLQRKIVENFIKEEVSKIIKDQIIGKAVKKIRESNVGGDLHG